MAAGALLCVVIWKLSEGINEALDINWWRMQIASAMGALHPSHRCGLQVSNPRAGGDSSTLPGTSHTKPLPCLPPIPHSPLVSLPQFPFLPKTGPARDPTAPSSPPLLPLAA